MARPLVIRGTHWECGDGSVNFFGYKGVVDQGGAWRVSSPDNKGFENIEPTTVSKYIAAQLEDYSSDRGSRPPTKRIEVSASVAVLLFLEGVFSNTNLRSASDAKDGIRIRNVDLGNSNTVSIVAVSPGASTTVRFFATSDDQIMICQAK